MDNPEADASQHSSEPVGRELCAFAAKAGMQSAAIVSELPPLRIAHAAMRLQEATAMVMQNAAMIPLGVSGPDLLKHAQNELSDVAAKSMRTFMSFGLR